METSKELFNIKCPSCGGPVEGPGKCPFCSSTLMWEDKQLVVVEEADTGVEAESGKEFSMDSHENFVKKRVKAWEVALDAVGAMGVLAGVALMVNDVIKVVPMDRINTSFGIVAAALVILPTMLHRSGVFESGKAEQGVS